MLFSQVVGWVEPASSRCEAVELCILGIQEFPSLSLPKPFFFLSEGTGENTCWAQCIIDTSSGRELRNQQDFPGKVPSELEMDFSLF